jgi:hypothetical protein
MSGNVSSQLDAARYAQLHACLVAPARLRSDVEGRKEGGVGTIVDEAQEGTAAPTARRRGRRRP